MRNASIIAATLLLMPGAVLAQEAVRQNQQQEELRADWVVGTSVTTPEGETIGTIDDLLLDKEQGNVTAAILSVGGFLGFGAKQIAVDWQELQQEYDGFEIVLALSREEAEAAPAFNFRAQEQPPPPPAPAGAGDMGTAPATPQPPQ
jgi:sporulation protein YlmC with PRC-barrel domain